MELTAGLNLPLDVWRIEQLVTHPEELRLLMPQAHVPFDSAQWAEKLDPKTGAMSYFVYLGDKVVGHFAFLRPRQGLEVYLCFVYIAPPFRGQGLADQMLKLAEEIAVATLTVPTMLLNVRTTNTVALKLYHRAGYQMVSQEGDLIRMRKDLAAPEFTSPLATEGPAKIPTI